MVRRSQKRRQYFVDSKVQGALVGRVVLYWCVCLFDIALVTLCWRIVTLPPQPFLEHAMAMARQYAAPAVASLLLLPVVVLDIVRLSNRFAGPMVRLRRAMRELAEGKAVRPVHFRDGDYWLEFADEFNAVARRIESLESQQAKPETPELVEAVSGF